MNFYDIKDEIKESYRTPDDIINEFYIPLLSKAKTYDRAVGFFSSSILIDISKGLFPLFQNKGKMRLITSPRLQEEDIKAIEKGYCIRDIVEKVLIREWIEPQNYFEEERLNFLAHMIANGNLDIKIAFKMPIGLYHEKIGIITDFDNNKVAFSGSLNESAQATNLNFESIDVFTTWNNPQRVETKIKYFEETWNNLTQQLEVIEFPKILREKLETYKKTSFNKNIDEEEIYSKNFEQLNTVCNDNKIQITEKTKNIPELPFNELREYQQKAIDNWQKQNYQGIFDMATGTGKTYTGLGALVNLYNNTNGDIAAIICCPFIHLVEQWVEDLEFFNIEPIIGYGSSSQKNWKEKFKKAVDYHNYEIEGKKFFCFITTNATFKSDFVQEQIKKLNNKSLLMVDEAHYFGAECMKNILPQNFNYRLALSATIERHGDDDGTSAIFAYFGEKCIEYTLEMAINSTPPMLTPYKYYPILIYLTPEELSIYKNLTKKISKFILGAKSKDSLPIAAKTLLLQRARLIAGAENKIPLLKEYIEKYKNDKHILVYCGATNIDDPYKEDDSIESESMRQINVVSKMLGNNLNMKVAQFTASENMKERKRIKELFSKGDMLQVLVAIKCLDEGFNIPEIKTAFILASTTNPKEYIQRRGRVLRKAQGKEYAEIYDFITLPRPISETYNLSPDEQKYEQGLVNREFSRMQEFNRLAINSVENNKNLIWDLIDSFKLYDDKNVYDIL